jgi:hypothetical protein
MEVVSIYMEPRQESASSFFNREAKVDEHLIANGMAMHVEPTENDRFRCHTHFKPHDIEVALEYGIESDHFLLTRCTYMHLHAPICICIHPNALA